VVLVVAVAVGVVLRVWDLGGPSATFDESFTGSYSHLPLGRIPGALRDNDAHPPLDYLIRHFAGGIGDTLALRIPSAVFGVATLAVVVWWMWHRGWFGVAVVALTAVSPFQLLYAHQARMYALAILAGTVAAMAADRWRHDAAPRWRWWLAAALLVGLFDLSSFLLYAGALFLVPGRRRDAPAWRWRATVAGCGLIWAAVWGLSFIHQAQGQHSTWIAYTTVSGAGGTLAGFVSFFTAWQWVAVGLVAVGGVTLWRRQPSLGALWGWLFVLPLVAACVIGLRAHFLLTRALAPGAWGVPVALAAMIDAGRRRSVAIGMVLAVAALLVMSRSISEAVTYQDGSAPAVRALAGEVRPGDAVLVYPDWLWPLVVWNDGVPRTNDPPTALRHLSTGAFVSVVGARPFDGRVWVLEPTAYRAPTAGLVRCPQQPAQGGDYSLTCYQAPDRGLS
jgi:hypothetical protein